MITFREKSESPDASRLFPGMKEDRRLSDCSEYEADAAAEMLMAEDESGLGNEDRWPIVVILSDGTDERAFEVNMEYVPAFCSEELDA